MGILMAFFLFEQKLKNQTQYSLVSIQYLYSQRCGDFNSTDLNFVKLLNLIFSSKHFIISILDHQNYIFMIFEFGEIYICGKTGKTRMCFQSTNLRTVSHFISRNKTYFMFYFEIRNNFAVYHIPSGEIFIFENSSLKSILLNPNSELDYNFFKNNGTSSRFADSKDYLFNQMMTQICKIRSNQISKALNPDLNKILNEIHVDKIQIL